MEEATKRVEELKRQAAKEAEAHREEKRRIKRHLKARTVRTEEGVQFRLWGLHRPPRLRVGDEDAS
jgi:hypothetical protein